MERIPPELFVDKFYYDEALPEFEDSAIKLIRENTIDENPLGRNAQSFVITGFIMPTVYTLIGAQKYTVKEAIDKGLEILLSYMRDRPDRYKIIEEDKVPK